MSREVVRERDVSKVDPERTAPDGQPHDIPDREVARTLSVFRPILTFIERSVVGQCSEILSKKRYSIVLHFWGLSLNYLTHVGVS